MTLIDPIEAQPSPAIVSINDIEVDLGIDLSQNVENAQVVSSPISTVTDLDFGTVISLTDTPTIVGSTVHQIFRPSTQFTAGHSYRWVVQYTLDVSNRLAATLQINVEP